MMSKRLTGQELFDEWKRREKEQREEEERKRAEKRKLLPNICKYCNHSWYRLIPPRGNFTEYSEYCGCRIKNDLVSPNGTCDLFKP